MSDDPDLLRKVASLRVIAPRPEVLEVVRARAKRRLQPTSLGGRLAEVAVFATVVAYLGWAVRFASALYR